MNTFRELEEQILDYVQKTISEDNSQFADVGFLDLKGPGKNLGLVKMSVFLPGYLVRKLFKGSTHGESH